MQVIVVLPSVLMLSWLGIEVGLALRAAAVARHGADAVALAAAARFDEGFPSAVADALTAAAASRAPAGSLSISVGPGPAGGSDLEFGRWDRRQRVFVPDREGGRAVRSTVRFAADHPNGAPGLVLPAFFPGVAVEIERQSVAVFVPPKHLVSALVLESGRTALEIERAARLRTRGTVLVASNDASAVRVEGDPRVLVAELRVAGGLDEGSEERIDSDVVVGVAIPADPYASTALPPLDPTPAEPIEHDHLGTTFVYPGVHSALTATGGRVVLLTGVHQFDGPISLAGAATLELQNATLRLGPLGRLLLSDRAEVEGGGSNEIPGWEDFWILQESGGRSWNLADSARIDVKGHAWAPTTRIELEGSARMDTGTLVAGTVRARGDSVLRLRESIERLEATPVPGRAKLVR